MGVTGLWRLIEPSGKPVPLETLENKVLAIDVSIWLHQAIKGFQDSQGAAVPNAHLLGIYHRLCKLLYFRIKPVFVFDGGVPHLKKETIVKRQQHRSKKLSEAAKLQQQLLSTLLKHTAIKNVLSEKTKATLTSPNVSPTKKKESENLYVLPPSNIDEVVTSSDEETTESDYSPTKSWDLDTIDEKSKHFKSLPADVRHDILTDLKATRKQSSWGKIHEMPKNSGDFSGFQMKRLLKRYSVQTSLDEVTKEMGGHSLSLAELEVLLNEQGVVTSSGSRIASDENARYLLIKDIKKAIDEAKLQNDNEKVTEDDIEYQQSLEAAIQLSLQDVPSTSKSEPEGCIVETWESNIKSAGNSDIEEPLYTENNMAKNYMIEYSGLTPSEIEKVMGKTTTKKKEELPARINGPKSSLGDETFIGISDSSDDELVEVKEAHALSGDIEIVVEANKGLLEEDDLFKDIFVEAVASSCKVTNVSGEESCGSVLATSVSNKSSQEIYQPNITVINEVNKSPDSEVDDQVDVEIHSQEKLEHLSTLTSLNEKSTDKIQILEDISIMSTSVEQDQKDPDQNHLNKSSIEGSAGNEIMIDEVSTSSNHLTVEDLQDMAADLRNEKIDLEAVRLAKERMATNLTDQIHQEAQELLQLFGVPYITAPMEAEAQCAFLNSINLTDGTITDDSDIWLFGGTTVYKNFFNQQKHVLEYRLENIQQHFKLTRNQMILLALLVGSDYTTGLQGVGPVTALEILAKFPSNDDITSGLLAFRKWLCTDKTGRNVGLRNKLKNVVFTEGFPSLQVVNAYLEPAVDVSKETFSWAKPDVKGLIEFARQKFGWNLIKSEEILKPVLKRLNESNSQRSIKDYFKTKHKIVGGDVAAKMSKRVKKAIDEIAGETNSNEAAIKDKELDKTEDKDLKVLKKTIAQSKRKVREIKKKINEELQKPKVAPDLHKKEVIPQKEQDKVHVLRNKLKAIEVLRKSKAGPGYVKKRKHVVRKEKSDALLSESSSD